MFRALSILLLFMTSVVGCQSGPDRKETVKVTGQLMIDGKPAESVAIYCHNTEGIDKSEPTMSECFTGRDGKFEIATYQKGDGVPPGDYTLTFMAGQFDGISMSYGKPDKLNGRYEDPTKSEVKFTVESGVPLDLGVIELTTK